MRRVPRVPRVQPLQFPPSADRTAATQLLIRSIRDALSGMFDVADPTGTVTLTSPVWVPGWHAPLLKLTKAAISPNRDDTHDLPRLIDYLFSQLQERLTSGSSGPDAFRTLLAGFADHFDRAPRGAALATLQNFGVRTGTPFASYLRALRVVVASTVEKGGPLAPSVAMVIESIRIRTAQQYPMLMPTLFPGDLATREKLYVTLASMWTAFGNLKHNMSPAIDGYAFASVSRTLSSHAPPTVAVSAASAAVSQRHYSRPTRPSHTVSNVSHAHSRRDPFRVDYGLWLFDDKDYDIVCSVTNHMLNTKMSLWTHLLTEDARRQACIQYSGRCCSCGSTDHSLRWCPATFANNFSLLNPEFATHDTDGFMFEVRCRKRKCVGGAVVTRTASTKIMVGVMPLEMATPATTTNKTVAPPLPWHTSPQLRLNLSRPRTPLASPQPSRLPLSCGMALHPRVAPTRTPDDQVRFRFCLLLLHDGSKTVPHP